MKFVDLTNTEKSFKPVTIQITFETESELAEFYARMNTNHDSLYESFPNSYKGNKNRNGHWDAFKAIKKYFE